MLIDYLTFYDQLKLFAIQPDLTSIFHFTNHHVSIFSHHFVDKLWVKNRTMIKYVQYNSLVGKYMGQQINLLLKTIERACKNQLI